MDIRKGEPFSKLRDRSLYLISQATDAEVRCAMILLVQGDRADAALDALCAIMDD